MAAIFYYVTVTPFVIVQFCPTFDMLFSGPNSSRKYHKTFSCNFLGVSQHYDPTNSVSVVLPPSFNISISADTAASILGKQFNKVTYELLTATTATTYSNAAVQHFHPNTLAWSSFVISNLL